MVGFSSRPTGR